MSEEKKVLDTEIVVSMSNATYKGEVGPQGPKGEPGDSAYDIAVKNGFEGTEEEWLASLHIDGDGEGQIGADGKSAYEIAVDNGFVGTETEWLASLKGIKGDTGATGPQGPKGDKGDTGETGPQGPKGDKGDAGATGPQGETGPAGQDGATPVKGVDYFTQADINSIVAQVPPPDLTDYATKAYLEQVVRGIETGALKRSIVQTLPTEDIDDDTIYMVPKTGSAGDAYNEYLYVNNTWELIGSTEVDLTNYATKSYVDGAVFSGDYEDLTNKPTIPSAYTLPTATTATLGGVKVDGSTITINDGVISAASSGGGSSYTFTNGLTEDSGTVSLDLNDKFLKPYNNSIGIGSFITPNNQNNNTGWYNLVVGKSEGSYKAEPMFQCQSSSGSILFGKVLAYNSKNRAAITSYGNNGGNIVGGSVNSYDDASEIGVNGDSNIVVGHASGGSITVDGSCNIVVGENTASGGQIIGNMCAGDRSASADNCQAFGTSIQVYGNNQMGHGKNNVVDKNNIFAEIVGNGNDYNSRSNASALDWSGNQYLAGNLYVGCSDYSTTSNGLTTANCGGNKVATEAYVDTAVANAGGSGSGGATYTAGSGISIDENNVISNNIFHLIAVMTSPYAPIGSDGPFVYNGNVSFVQSYGNTLDHNGLVQLLKQHKIVYIKQNPYSSSDSLKLHQNDFLNDGATLIPYIKYGDGKYIDYGNMSSGYMPQSGEYLYWDGAKLHTWEYAGNIIRHMKINSTDTLGRVIDNLNTRIPAAPTTDGDYILKVSVSSGTPTYSWVEATIGGSY